MNSGKISAGESFSHGFYFTIGALTAITVWGILSFLFFTFILSQVFYTSSDSSLPNYSILYIVTKMTQDQRLTTGGIIMIILLSTFLVVNRLRRRKQKS